MWLYLNGRGQALQENDGRRIRERLLVRDRDQRVCADDRDSAREQAPQGRTPKVDQALSRNRQGRSSYEATPDQVRGKGRRTGPASRPSDRYYTSNRETKDFLAREAQKIAPGLKRKSGTRYRLNRWREEQLTAGKRITYRDLVRQYVQLNQAEEPFAQIPYDCYVNFLSDFSKGERDATRADALAAWKQLKRMNVPKNYRAWRKAIDS